MIKYILLLLGIVFINFINMILRFFKTICIYDVQNGDDITIIYYFLKLLSFLKINVCIIYPKIGVCRYIDNKYVRYICYDSNLLRISYKPKMNLDLIPKNYDDIKKIELILETFEQHKLIKIDVTNAKNNFYDFHNTITNLSDIVKFYLIIEKKSIVMPEKINSIIITRETFNDDLLEFVTTYTEIKYN